MLVRGWTPEQARQVVFPTQMKVRSFLFNQLSDEERGRWEDAALKTKEAAPTAYVISFDISEFY